MPTIETEINLSFIICFICHGGPYFEDNFMSVDKTSFVAAAEGIFRESCSRTKKFTKRFLAEIFGRTTCQPDLTTFLQPRHIPTQGYNITQS